MRTQFFFFLTHHLALPHTETKQIRLFFLVVYGAREQWPDVQLEI